MTASPSGGGCGIVNATGVVGAGCPPVPGSSFGQQPLSTLSENDNESSVATMDELLTVGEEDNSGGGGGTLFNDDLENQFDFGLNSSAGNSGDGVQMDVMEEPGIYGDGCNAQQHQDAASHLPLGLF
jgi:hypothetical protein